MKPDHQINKLEFSELIWLRLNKGMPKKQITDIINIILGYMEENFRENQDISLENFGTFSIYEISGHDAIDISTGKRYFCPPFNTVKLFAHQGFIELLQPLLWKFKETNETD